MTQLNPGRELAFSSADAYRRITFIAAPELHVRIIGVRYRKAGVADPIEPRPIDYDRIRSWLSRVYPTPRVVFSQRVLPAIQTWPFNERHINAIVNRTREQDVANGADPRMRYFGYA